MSLHLSLHLRRCRLIWTVTIGVMSLSSAGRLAVSGRTGLSTSLSILLNIPACGVLRTFWRSPPQCSRPAGPGQVLLSRWCSLSGSPGYCKAIATVCQVAEAWVQVAVTLFMFAE
jgi:hypothetical protein